MSQRDWYTVEDENELLLFLPGPLFAKAREHFRALYMEMPGFPAPTIDTARAVDFTVGCSLHPQGVYGPYDQLTFARKIPAGFIAMQENSEMDNIMDTLRRAISTKHSTEIMDHIESQGYRCCKCKKPVKDLGGGSLLGDYKVLVLFTTPICGSEACRMECEAEVKELIPQVAAHGRNSNNPAYEKIARCLAEPMNRTCRVCEKKDDTDPNGFKNKTCSRCKLVYYCSPACQKKHWPVHKVPCKKAAQK